MTSCIVYCGQLMKFKVIKLNFRRLDKVKILLESEPLPIDLFLAPQIYILDVMDYLFQTTKDRVSVCCVLTTVKH